MRKIQDELLASEAVPTTSFADASERQEESAGAEQRKAVAKVEAQPIPSAANAVNGDQPTPHPGDAGTEREMAEPTGEMQAAAPATDTEKQADAAKPAQEAVEEETPQHDQTISEAGCPNDEEELEARTERNDRQMAAF